MALIDCRECGKQISDTAKKCPHCGFINKELQQDKMSNFKNVIKQHVKVIIIITIVLLVGIIGTIVYNKQVEQAEIQANALTEDEKMIVNVVKKLKTSLKNPESLQVFEIIYSKSSDMSATVIIDSAGQNGFGGTTRRRYMYLTKADGTITYWGDDDKADKTVTKYTSTKEKLEIAASKVVREYWNKRKNYFVVDKDKIMRNLE